MFKYYVKIMPQCQNCNIASFRPVENSHIHETYCPLLHSYYREKFIEKTSNIDNYSKYGGRHDDCPLQLIP